MDEKLALDVIDGTSVLAAWGMKIVMAVVILVVARLLGKWVDRLIHKVKRLDETLSFFLGALARYTILAIAIVTILGQFGVQTASLIAVLGAAGLAIGLALQGTLSNVAAGVMLLILRPFKVGDYITAGSINGTVKSLGLFGTELATLDNVYIFAPNSAIWKGDIYNFSRNDQRRHDLTVGISYDDDVDLAIKVLTKVLDKDDRVIRSEGKEPQIELNNMGDFSVDLLVRFWCKRTDFAQMKWDMNKAFKAELEKAGIDIPFPTRTLKMVQDAPKAPAKKKSATKKKAA
jgi:small conductance mechanosensitive channel